MQFTVEYQTMPSVYKFKCLYNNFSCLAKHTWTNLVFQGSNDERKSYCVSSGQMLQFRTWLFQVMTYKNQVQQCDPTRALNNALDIRAALASQAHSTVCVASSEFVAQAKQQAMTRRVSRSSTERSIVLQELFKLLENENELQPRAIQDRRPTIAGTLHRVCRIIRTRLDSYHRTGLESRKPLTALHKNPLNKP